MKQYRFEAAAAVQFDVESAFEWYETEEPDLGFEFLEQLRGAYQRYQSMNVNMEEKTCGN